MVVFSKDVGVKVCDSQSMHVWSTNYVTNWRALYFDCLSLREGRGRAMVNSYQPPP